MKPFYKHVALGFRSTQTHTHTSHTDMSVNKEFHFKVHENMNGTAVALRYKDQKHSKL